MEIITASRLILVPASGGAADACSRIASIVKGTIATPYPSAPPPSLRQAVGEDGLLRLLASVGANPQAGGMIILHEGGEAIESDLLAGVLRRAAKPTEFIDISRLGGTDKAVRYGTELAVSMLILLRHLSAAAAEHAIYPCYTGGSGWLDEEFGEVFAV